MDYEAFILSPHCKPLLLPEEDQPQDVKEWKRLLDSDRQRQYNQYLKLHQPASLDVPASDEEKRVVEKLAKLTKKNLSGGVEAAASAGRGSSIDANEGVPVGTTMRMSSAPPAQKFDRKAYQRGYMRDWRARRKGDKNK